ncbi:MAG TPA: helix-turn-helix transcriptional regulator [Pelobium sp.]|nr:helix-turn-helix transcriptional regulator [Pelobium sp.]
METVYTDKFINICYHKNSSTLSGVWNPCETTLQYNYTLDNFRDFFDRLKPKNTLCNKQNLDFKLYENFNQKADTFLKETPLNKGFERKIAVVLNDDLYKKSTINNLAEKSDDGLKLRYFNKEQTAIEWLHSYFYDNGTNLVSQLNVKDTGNNTYEISLTVNKADVHEYLSILDHLLKNRDFCLENVHRFNSLTCREREILQYVLKGFKNMEIADNLFLSVETIKTHRKRILAKLTCQNIYSLAQYSVFF